MAADLFGDVTRPTPRIGSRRSGSLPLSIATHGIIVAAILLTPLVASVERPEIRRGLALGDVDITPVEPPPAPRRVVPRANAIAPGPSRAAAPLVAPPVIGPEPVIETGPLVGDPGPEIGGGEAGVPGGLGEWTLPAPPSEALRGPVRPGGRINAPRKIADVRPVYPAIAQSAGVEGTVVIEAIIGPSGDVEQARVVSSKPLLDAAALDAVRRWKYTPTLLNGIPVSVVMTVSVRFTLQK
jgi:protein TonB